jgi:hypothetical protein
LISFAFGIAVLAISESELRATLLAPVKTGNMAAVKFYLGQRQTWQLRRQTAIVAATFSAGAQYAMP